MNALKGFLRKSRVIFTEKFLYMAKTKILYNFSELERELTP